MQAIHMKTNHLTAPRGIDAGPLFLSCLLYTSDAADEL